MLPWAYGLLNGAELTISFSRCVGLVVVVAGTMALGGFVAYLVGGATSAHQAVAYGLGWQGTLGGVIQGARAEKAEAATVA